VTPVRKARIELIVQTVGISIFLGLVTYIVLLVLSAKGRI